MIHLTWMGIIDRLRSTWSKSQETEQYLDFSSLSFQRM